MSSTVPADVRAPFFGCPAARATPALAGRSAPANRVAPPRRCANRPMPLVYGFSGVDHAKLAGQVRPNAVGQNGDTSGGTSGPR
jgi:hypothetical protein